MAISSPLNWLKLFPICEVLPSSTPVKCMGREGKIWEWDISPGCKDNDSLPALGHTITTSLHQSNLVLVPS